MNKIYKLSLKAFALAAISFAATPAQAQLGNIGDLLQAGKEDANKLVQAYMAPMANAFGAGLNTGWVLNANAHGGFFPLPLPGFSLQLRSSATLIPDTDKRFDLTSLGLSSNISFPGNTTSPTIAGNKEDNKTRGRIVVSQNVTVAGVNQTVTVADLTLPEGLDVPFIPAPMIQAGVGLLFDTDITVRYFPKTEFGDYGNVGLIGASIKHGLDQWIPGGGLLPVNITLQAGFTKFTSGVNLSLTPLDLITDANRNQIANYNFANGFFDGQDIQFETTAYTVNAIVGKKISLLIVGVGAYVGAGIESSETILKMNGNYPLLVGNDNTAEIIQGRVLKVETIADPIDLTFKGQNSLRLLGGVRVSLGIFDFFGEYTVAKYPTANVGFAVSFRS